MNVHTFDNSHTLRASVLSGVSLFVAFMSLCFAIFNYNVVGVYPLVFLDICLLSYSLYTNQLAKKNKHKQHHIQLFTSILLFVIIATIYYQPAGHGTYIWAMIFPPLLYALLGLRHGQVFSAVFLCSLLSILYHKFSMSNSLVLFPTLSNLVSCYSCIWIISHIYEYNRQNTENSLTHLASRDSLTGTHNRLSLTSSFHSFECYQKDEKELCMLFIDLDHFKKVNDTYGHDAGDQVLIETSSIIRTIVGDDNLYRIGGEEFCITLFNKPIEEAERIGEKIRQQISQHTFIYRDKQIHITLCIGMCEYSEGDQLGDILKLADIQLYQAKENGRNQVRLSRSQKCCASSMKLETTDPLH